MDRTKTIAFGISIALILLAIVLSWTSKQKGSFSFKDDQRGRPAVGGLGSEHSHMSMLVFIDDVGIDFSVPEFQLKDDRIHFEDADGITVHKHAKGATLAMLFESLGMRISPDCIWSAKGIEYCSGPVKKLRSYLNRSHFVDWDTYELRANDKILIDYGSGTDVDLGLRLNAVPDLPEDL